jgi:hypothetical protein
MTQEDLKFLEEVISKASPKFGPYTSNYPFYADVTKPAPSMSKHDHERPTYWRIEDAVFIAVAREFLPKLVEEVKRLQKVENA